MRHSCCGGDAGQAGPGRAPIGVAGWLALAASPTFASMALATAILESDPASILCAGGSTSPLTGMSTMYLLMSAFHAAPWLQLVRPSSCPGEASPRQ